MSKVIFTGGSITAGYGWNLEDENDRSSPHMWVNLVHQNIPELKNLEKFNLGEHGTNNSLIFKKTLKAITSIPDIKYIFCSWVHLVRYELGLGFDHQHYTKLELCPAWDHREDIVLPNVVYQHKFINNIKNNFLALHHDHYEICKIIEYVNIINSLCEKYNIHVYHINDSCSWDKNYFSEMTEYTKNEIIDIKNRSAHEIQEIYESIHRDYTSAGGIQEHTWINLYNSFTDNIIDYNLDPPYHPGIESNKIYLEMIKTKLQSG